MSRGSASLAFGKKVIVHSPKMQRCNYSTTSIYNVWVDPEAAEIVMQFVERHGIKLTWVPLDATHEAYLDAKDADDIGEIGSPQAKYVASVIRKRLRGYANDADMKANAAAPIHDALAVCALIDPSVLIDCRPVNCHVDCGGGIGDAETCLDLRERTTKDAPNCYFAFHADRLKFNQMVYDILKRIIVYS